VRHKKALQATTKLKEPRDMTKRDRYNCYLPL
jgi:hypothetical protein